MNSNICTAGTWPSYGCITSLKIEHRLPARVLEGGLGSTNYGPTHRPLEQRIVAAEKVRDAMRNRLEEARETRRTSESSRQLAHPPRLTDS